MSSGYDQSFTRSVTINAVAPKVWDAITDPNQMAQWMADTNMEIVTDWTVGGPITMHVQMYRKGMTNNGKVLQFTPVETLEYTHLSSISRLPDTPESYTHMIFRLDRNGQQTLLTLTVSNFPTYSIYKHHEFYWSVTLDLLKKFVER